jgi:hypothetical protein
MVWQGFIVPLITTYNFTNQENIMRTLRQLFAAPVLVLMLSLSVFAGEMSTTITPPPAPAQGDISTPANEDIHIGLVGDMNTGNSEKAAGGESVAVAAALSVVECVLSFL